MQNQHIPLKDFFRNPDKSNYQISPSGLFISWLAPFESRMNVYVQDRRDERTFRLTAETERDIAGYFWKTDNRIVYVVEGDVFFEGCFFVTV